MMKTHELPPPVVRYGADSSVPLAICVFCGARPGHREAISVAARETGALIGSRGHHLVYGAGGTGLMGEVARSVWSSGGSITGYAPQFIYERERDLAMPQQTLHITKNLFERKRRMIKHADAFIALPGGYGTLDEILEVLSLACLDIGHKPLILLNTENFWQPLVDLANSLHATGFTDRSPGSLFRTARSPAEAIALAEQACRAAPGVPAGAVQ
ncbi:MAG TPA: TIGR00730 family Rossman fold protein [Streptosporangiaceae bacterium]|nr:TIGR00730 family Rossman fold protein [Streptosporangiaceae bacterium]